MKLHDWEESNMKCNCSSETWNWPQRNGVWRSPWILIPLKLCLSGQPLTSQFFFSDIVWRYGSMFTIRFALLSRCYSLSLFTSVSWLEWAKQNALLDEMFPITQWINTNLFIWMYSWQRKPSSEFIENTLRKVTLLKKIKKKQRVFSDQWGILLYNLANKELRDLMS